jgi:hypothetical protein
MNASANAATPNVSAIRAFQINEKTWPGGFKTDRNKHCWKMITDEASSAKKKKEKK